MSTQLPDVRPEAGRPLMTGMVLVVLCAVAMGALLKLLGGARQRTRRAAELAPSTLSLTFLRIGLRERPNDLELRFALAQQSLDAGLFDEALEVLEPLVGERGKAGQRARLARVEVAYRMWAAAPAREVSARERAFAFLIAHLEAAAESELSEPQALRLAELAAECERQALRATILGRLARSAGTPREASVTEASAAYLEASDPFGAAELHAWAARASNTPLALRHALAAVDLARMTGRPRETWALFVPLWEQFPGSVELAERGVSLARDLSDDALALSFAKILLAERPDDRALHVMVAQLASFTGHGLLAMDEYAWLARRGGSPLERARAIELASANADLRLLASLQTDLGREGSTEELIDRVALYEALGRPERARSLVKSALEGSLSADVRVWELSLALEIRAGDAPAALATLSALERRFGRTGEREQRRAELLAELGALRQAAEALLRSSSGSEEERLREVANLAWASDDVGLAARAYETLSERSSAAALDFHRLALLRRELGDERGALSSAQRGFERFHSAPMFWLATSAALELDDEAALDQLFARAERVGTVALDPAYIRLRVSHRQALAADALSRRNYRSAERLLGQSGRDLRRLQRLSPDPNYGVLRRAQRAQELALALGLDDRTRLARAYDEQRRDLSVTDRVYVLHRLGEHELALSSALLALNATDLSARERAVLSADATSLAAPLPRRLFVHGDLTDMGELTISEGEVGAEYSFDHGGFMLAALFAELDVAPDARFSLDQTHQLSVLLGGSVRGERHKSALTLGVDTRNARVPRPFGLLTQELRVGDSAQLALAARLNEVASDTAALRALGVRDSISLAATVRLGKRVVFDARATGLAYATRNRNYLGSGVTGDAALGVEMLSPSSPHRGNVRVASRIAPRFPVERVPDDVSTTEGSPGGWLVPDDSTWLGLGLTFSRGELTRPEIVGRSVSYLLDGAVGYLWPNRAPGFFSRAGIGAPLVGKDLLSLSGRAGNVIGTQPGTTVWSIEADYALSLWR